MMLESSDHQRYLYTIEYTAVEEEMSAVSLDQLKENWTMGDIVHLLAGQNIQVCSKQSRLP